MCTLQTSVAAPSKEAQSPIGAGTAPKPAAVAAVIDSSPSSGGDKKEETANNGASFFLLLLIVAGAMAAVGVWKLGGIEKTKLHLKGLIESSLDRVKGRSYSQLNSNGLPC